MQLGRVCSRCCTRLHPSTVVLPPGQCRPYVKLLSPRQERPPPALVDVARATFLEAL